MLIENNLYLSPSFSVAAIGISTGSCPSVRGLISQSVVIICFSWLVQMKVLWWLSFDLQEWQTLTYLPIWASGTNTQTCLRSIRMFSQVYQLPILQKLQPKKSIFVTQQSACIQLLSICLSHHSQLVQNVYEQHMWRKAVLLG